MNDQQRRWLLLKNKQKNWKITSVDKNVEKLEPLCTVGGIAKWCDCYGKRYGMFLKKLKIELPHDPAIHFCVYGSKQIEIRVLKRYAHTHVHSSIIHNSQEVEAIQMSINR